MRLHEEFRVEVPVDVVWALCSSQRSSAVRARCRVGDGARRGPGGRSPRRHRADERHARSEGDHPRAGAARADPLRGRPGAVSRGAVGNIRASTRYSCAVGTAPLVVLEGEVVLAGALGQCGSEDRGQASHPGATQFAANLQRALGGEAPAAGTPTVLPGPAPGACRDGPPHGSRPLGQGSAAPECARRSCSACSRCSAPGDATRPGTRATTRPTARAGRTGRVVALRSTGRPSPGRCRPGCTWRTSSATAWASPAPMSGASRASAACAPCWSTARPSSRA